MYERYEMLLRQKGVLTVDVCRATGISQTVMSNWKKRGGGLSADNAAKIANYFGVSVTYLMGQTDFPEPPQEYYIYGETAKQAQELFEDKDMRLLFDAAKGSKPEDLRMAADLLNRLKETNPDG